MRVSSRLSRIDTTAASPVFGDFPWHRGGRRRRKHLAQHAEPALQPPPRRQVERRQHFGEVRLRRTRPTRSSAARPVAVTSIIDDPAVAFRRRPPHPAALRHRADRVRHGRQADALRATRGRSACAAARSGSTAGRNAPGPAFAGGAQLGGDGAHHQRDDFEESRARSRAPGHGSCCHIVIWCSLD